MDYAHFIRTTFEIRVIVYCVLSLILFLYPQSLLHAQVLISEFAWMGTDADPNNEWIELYNESSNPVDLTGWTISGSLTITLSGTLTPNGVGVLERTDDDSAPGTALLIYTGALANQTGGSLILKDQSGITIDQVVGEENWSNIGGSNEVPKMTPQRTEAGTWVTAAPTPGRVSLSAGEDAPPTTTQSVTHTSSGSSGGGGAVRRVATSTMKPTRTPGELSLAIKAQQIGYVDQEISFEAIPEGVGKTVASSLSYAWNFGDSYTGSRKKVSHQFSFPGEYIVVAEAKFAKQIAVARYEVTILPVAITLTRTEGGDIVLQNNATHEIDLSGYILKSATEMVFPKFSILKSGGSITIDKSRITKESGLPVLLSDSTGAVLARDEGTTATPPVAMPQLKTAIVATPATTTTQTGTPTVLPISTSSTRIQIGNHSMKDTAQSPGILTRILQKLSGFFD